MNTNEYREEVIQRYITELDAIFKNGTHGDYTAIGFVSELVRELDQVSLNMPPKKDFLESYGDYEYPEGDDWYYGDYGAYPEDEYEYDLDEADHLYDFR